MSGKVRVLGVAPYEGLASMMQQYARKRTDIEMTVITANMEKGMDEVRQMYTDFDIVISRANTARVIRQECPRTVIDIGIGYYDVLRCIKLAESAHSRFAIVGFRTLTAVAQTICDLLRMPVDVFSITTSQEAKAILNDLKRSGYSAIICDALPYSYAKIVGITPYLLTSSEESLEAAIDQAVYLYQQNQRMFSETDMLKEMISSSSNQYIVLNLDGKCLFSTWHEPQQKEFTGRLGEELRQCRTEKKRSFFVTLGQQMYSVFSTYIDYAEKPYVIFRIIPCTIPLEHSKYGIAVTDKRTVMQGFIDRFIYNNTDNVNTLVENAAKTNIRSSLMIVGETGTGKDHMANVYYVENELCNNPMFVINCSLLNEKSWRFLTNSYNSPFTDNNNTIYISNIDRLSQEQQKNLLSIIIDTNVHIRNRLVFSCTQREDGSIPHVVKQFSNSLGCILVTMRPLREFRKDIPSMAGMYLNMVNQSAGKVVSGFEDGAMKLLQDYYYPHNNIQFKRILKEAVMSAQGFYISEETIREILEHEDNLYGQHKCSVEAVEENTGGAGFFVEEDQTMEEMNRRLVLHILEKCGGNQTAAAKKLGIGRTTLWRYIRNKAD